jgi:hypothetical protein
MQSQAYIGDHKDGGVDEYQAEVVPLVLHGGGSDAQHELRKQVDRHGQPGEAHACGREAHQRTLRDAHTPAVRLPPRDRVVHAHLSHQLIPTGTKRGQRDGHGEHKRQDHQQGDEILLLRATMPLIQPNHGERDN